MERWLQQVRAIAALAENQDSVLSTHTTTPFPTVSCVACFADGKVESAANDPAENSRQNDSKNKVRNGAGMNTGHHG